MSPLAGKWKKVQGEDQWKGLLKPLDEDLCQELIRYGQFVQTVYDSVNLSSVSNGRGFPRFGKSEIFEKLHVKANYTITKYFYCSVVLNSLLGKLAETILPFSGPTTSWFGYVAVSDDEETKRLGRRDIVIVFRGTLEDVEWANNLLNSFQGDVGSKPGSEPMASLVPLDAPKDVTPVVAETKPVVVEETVTTTVVVDLPPEPKKKSPFGMVTGVIGKTVSDVVSVSTEVVSGVTNAAGGVLTLLPWQKALLGNRWLAPYVGVNEADKNGFGKKSARAQIIEALTELTHRYKDEELSVTVTGHSLGAAIATVCAYDLVNEKKNVNPKTGKRFPVTAFTFASPRVGNLEFQQAADRLTKEGLRILWIHNVLDLVPDTPPLLWGYVHAGQEFQLSTVDSKYVKFPTLNLGDPHNMQLYLHLVANKTGSLKYHQLELVNKSCDVLKDPTVPGAWWVVENQDVIFNNGRWEMRKYDISIDNKEIN